ncbi:LOW QUALITY PROTEIN: hypothetical protein PHMEG_00030674 [Phytophthora megakarya]|uniref:Eukaryotic/viral aspartic protease n=1 Tax=Phytophthora megakarya TaxID=4795 RepID=A0A225UZS9_9STRA|nr:LOW QUALITY PROTEIN: hypothetical protein PHMEG_00030674 [Phytophthora megakarya]
MNHRWIIYIGSILKIKDGNAKERREHVDHYIETLEEQDLAERLTLLRLTDADDLEENRQKKAAFGSSKYRQKPTNSTPSAPAKQVRAIQVQANDSGSDSESDGSGGSDSDVDNHRKIFFAANEDVESPRKWRRSRRAWIHDSRSVIKAIKITTRRSTVMGLTAICVHTVDPGSIRILDPDLWFKPTDQEVTPEIQRHSKVAEYRQSTTMDLLPDTGAEVSIVDTAFARKVGCYIDSSQIQDCVGIGDNVY